MTEDPRIEAVIEVLDRERNDPRGRWRHVDLAPLIVAAADRAAWRPIGEAPKDGTPIWVYIAESYQTSAIYSRGQWREKVGDEMYLMPRHWAPLLPKPIGQGDNK